MLVLRPIFKQKNKRGLPTFIVKHFLSWGNFFFLEQRTKVQRFVFFFLLVSKFFCQNSKAIAAPFDVRVETAFAEQSKLLSNILRLELLDTTFPPYFVFPSPIFTKI
uniref:Uncharacterized protein n=1 Tax=Cacopsylla melanoneura TaxID=428564 RepID=A0A8D8VXB3_9HEMI